MPTKEYIVECANNVLGKSGKAFKLNPNQEDILNGILGEKCNIFAVLPTGSGKSLPFMLMPLLCNTYGHELSIVPNGLVLVISPLISLIDAHVKEIQSYGIRAKPLKDIKEKDDFKDVQVVLGTPESWITEDKWKQMLLDDDINERILMCVADEVHCIPKWGMSDKKKVKPFRQSFGRLGELKSFLPENTPWLVLTATATKETIRLIQKSLNLTNVTFVKSSPNRENIVYSVSKITADIKTTFGWLLQEIENNGVQVDRTIIYCNQIKQCADIFDHLKQSLGAKMFFQSRQEVPNRLVAMYHHSTKQHIKDAVLSSLLDSSGTIRVVIATSALGMGVNMQNVRRVIHYGPPKDIEAYMQESGRGGRDGGLAYATLLYYPRQLVRISAAMKMYCTTKTTCRRKLLMDHFASKSTKTLDVPHLCCDICRHSCKCGSNEVCTYEPPKFDNTVPEVNSTTDHVGLTRSVKDEDRILLRDVLEEARQTFVMNHVSFGIDSQEWFSDLVIEDIISQAPFIFSIEYIVENLPIISLYQAHLILVAFQETFEDFDLCTEELSSLSFDEFDFSFDDLDEIEMS